MLKFENRTQKAIAITEIQLRIAELRGLSKLLREDKVDNKDMMREVERIANLASFQMSVEALEQTLKILGEIDADISRL
jgi:hypothetical protein